MSQDAKKHGSRMPSSKLISIYNQMKAEVVKRGNADGLEWARTTKFEDVTATSFLEEYAWVVLNSGMRYKTVDALWKDFSQVFYDWDIEKIAADDDVHGMR